MAWHYVGSICFEEKMLWLSVLRRAVFDYVLYKGIGMKSLDWKRANNFIFGEARGEHSLTFEEICALFSWEPEYVQRLTRNLTRADVRKLETSKFRNEFTLDILSELVKNNLKWATIGLPVPYFPPKNYTESLRRLVTLQPVKITKPCILVYAPRIVWKVAA